MEEKFDSKVMRLEQEIFDISKNINKFKSKNHKTLQNMMEKIKSFSNELKANDETKNENKQINYQNKTKHLSKAYQNFPNKDITPTNPKNKIYQFDNTKIPIILKQREIYNNINEEDRPTFFYSNKIKKNKKNKYLTNMSYNLASDNNKNFDNNKVGRNNNNKEEMNKCFSFNYNDFNNINQENDNDIKQRTNSLNNLKLNHIYKNNDLSNDCSNNDLKYSKKKKKIYSKIKNHHKKNIKKVNSYNLKDIPKKLIKSINNLSNHQNNSSREIKNIKREHCNINISEYYKNINNKEKFLKKKNGRVKITNHKKLKNYVSGENNNTKSDSKNISNGNNNSSTSRNYIYNKIYQQTCSSRTKNNKTNSEKDFSTNYICSTFNPYDNIKNDNESYCDGRDFKGPAKTVNTLREKIPINKNLLLINYNSSTINNSNQNEKERISEYNYSYFTSRNNNNYNYNMNIDNNKGKIINNNNYSKDFIDIITNKNNDHNNYDYVSIYNNNINQKKQENSIPSYNNKYINIDEKQYNKLLSLLKCNNIADVINKIDDLLKYESFINKIKYLYDKTNNSYISKFKDKNLKDIFSWIELNLEQNKRYKDELKKYQNFCGKLMEEFNGDGFDKFKIDILKAVNKNKKEQNLVYGNYNSNINNGNKNIINTNKENINLNSQFYNSQGNVSFKNETSSYSNINVTNFKNADEITITNIKNGDEFYN